MNVNRAFLYGDAVSVYFLWETENSSLPKNAIFS